MNKVISILWRLSVIIVLLLLPFFVQLGCVEFPFFSYYVKTNVVFMLSFLSISFYMMHNFYKIWSYFKAKSTLEILQKREKALLATVVNDKFLISRYSNEINDDSDSALYIKCKNFLNFEKAESAFELIQKCTNSEIRKSILFSLLHFYYYKRDLSSLAKVIESINVSFYDPYWSFKIQILFFYQSRNLERVISILKKPKIKDLSLGYDVGEFLAYCYLLLAKQCIESNKKAEAEQILKMIFIAPESSLNIIFAQCLLSIADKPRARKVLSLLCKSSVSVEAIDLYKNADGSISDLFLSDDLIGDYFIALEKYESGLYREALAHLATNSNNYLVYKHKAIILSKMGLIDEAQQYMFKLFSTKKVWFWKCDACASIRENYEYECSNCNALGKMHIISDD